MKFLALALLIRASAAVIPEDWPYSARKTIFSHAAEYWAMDAADVDKDGCYDAIAVANGGTNELLQPPGHGTSAEWTKTSLGGSYNAPSSVRFGDVLGSGYPDVVVADSNLDNVYLHENRYHAAGGCTPGNNGQSDGCFGQQRVVGTCAGAFFAEPGFIDDDGCMDVVAVCPGDASVVWFRAGCSSGVPDGSWERKVVYTHPDYVKDLVVVRIADMNQDGKMDLVAASSNENSFGLSVFLGSGTSSSFALAKTNYWLGPVNNIKLTDFVVEDFDGDGHPDVFAISADTNKMYLVRSNPSSASNWDDLMANPLEEQVRIWVLCEEERSEEREAKQSNELRRRVQ